MVSRCDNSLPITVRSSMLWFGTPTIIFIAAPHALHTLTSIPAPKGIKAAPLNTRLSLFAGRPCVQHKPLPLPAPGFGSSRPSASTSALAGSTLRTLCAVTLSRYPLFVPRGRPVTALHQIVPAPKGIKAAPLGSSEAWAPVLPVWP